MESIEEFLEHLAIPSECRLAKPVYKKLFLENGVLNAADKKCLKDDVVRIQWLYTLKPSTINIAAYQDEVREYLEVAVLQIELNQPNRAERVAEFMNRSIPYPLVLIFTMENSSGTNVLLSLTDKRINQADKEKWVLEDTVNSGWINLTGPSEPEMQFLHSLKVTELPFSDFWRFYQALMNRVIAINCAEHSGDFYLGADRQQRLEALNELEKLTANQTQLVSKIKKEKQMGKLVELNTQAKKIKDRIAEIKSSL